VKDTADGMEFDVIVHRGSVLDGTGAPARVADVGVTGERIAAIGDLSGSSAATEIDADGRIVAPGFIDVHTHSDLTVLVNGRAESKIRQGVTTEITGNCSFSPYPVRPGRPELVERYELRTALAGIDWDWSDLDGYARRVESSGTSVNIAPLVGQASVRIAVIGGGDGQPTPDQLVEMQRLVDQALEQGAFGMSVGLTLVPSGFADTNELIALAEPLGRYGRLYVQHSRLWAGWHAKTIEEAVQIGRAVGCGVQISHQAIVDSREYGTASNLIGIMERARTDGVDVMYDVYPYLAGGTTMDQLVPTWVQDGGVEAMLARLEDSEMRRRAITDTNLGWFRGLPFDWTKLFMTEVGTPESTRYLGWSVAQVAEEWGLSGAETVIELIRRERNHVGVVMFNRDEDDMRTFLRHPLAMVGSDGSAIAPYGPFAESKPHPRFYGTYPRILGRYVREAPVLSLADAVHKMTGLPAERFGLAGRGRMAENMLADLVVFDPRTVIDIATFEQPHAFPIGIHDVLVAGQPVVRAGEHTGAMPGRVLRAS